MLHRCAGAARSSIRSPKRATGGKGARAAHVPRLPPPPLSLFRPPGSELAQTQRARLQTLVRLLPADHGDADALGQPVRAGQVPRQRSGQAACQGRGAAVVASQHQRHRLHPKATARRDDCVQDRGARKGWTGVPTRLGLGHGGQLRGRVLAGSAVGGRAPQCVGCPQRPLRMRPPARQGARVWRCRSVPGTCSCTSFLVVKGWVGPRGAWRSQPPFPPLPHR